MLSPQELYPLVETWVQEVAVCPKRTSRTAVTHLVVALLSGQSLRPAELMRTLLSPTVVPARQRYKRVARSWDRPWLTSALLTPGLVRAALALVPPEREGLTDLALDSVRCGAWEVFTLGVVWQGRVLPLAWAVPPYPWPKGRVTPTVQALVRQGAALWPPARPVHLVADRAFPSHTLFTTLQAVGWGWTVRLRAPMPVTVADERLTVRDLLARARPNGWSVWTGAYGSGRTAIPATLVVGRGLPTWPRHQRTEGSQRYRVARQAERQRTRRYRYARVSATDAWMVLCTTHPTWLAAVRSYRRRWATEGSYRDAQSGWDGQHGWDLEPTLTQARSAAQGERLVGLWALGALLQTWLGTQLAHGPQTVRTITREWTTTGRLSVWAQGQLALREPSGRLHVWLAQTLRTGAAQIRAAAGAGPAPPLSLPTGCPPRPCRPAA